MDDEEREKVLDASELDITDDERVREIGDDRFVVSTDSGPPSVGDREPELDAPDLDELEAAEAADATGAADDSVVDAEGARDAITDELEDSERAYAVDATAVIEGESTSVRVEQDDVVGGFDELLEWYVASVGGDTSTAETLGLLLAEADATATYPVSTLSSLATAHGLGPDDTIADLVAACREAGGIDLGKHSQG